MNACRSAGDPWRTSRRARGCCAALALTAGATLLGAASQAFAQLEVIDRVRAGVGVTDNARSTERTLDGPQPESETFMNVTNTLLGTYTGSRYRLSAGHTVTATRYNRPYQPLNLNNALALTTALDPSARVQLTFIATGTHAHMASGAFVDPNAERVGFGARRTGVFSYLTASLEERLGWELSARWRADQSLALQTYHPLADEDVLQQYQGLLHSLSFRRESEHLASVFSATLGLRRLYEFQPVAAAVTDRTPQYAGLSAGLTWTPMERLAGNAGAGFVVYRSDAHLPMTLAPTAQIGANWQGDALQLSASFMRGIRGGVTVGELFLADTVTGTMALRLGEDDTIQASTSGSYARGRPLAPERSWRVLDYYAVTTSVSFRPWRSRDIVVALSHMFHFQATVALVAGEVRNTQLLRNSAIVTISTGLPWNRDDAATLERSGL